jgi:hypothetical protein
MHLIWRTSSLSQRLCHQRATQNKEGGQASRSAIRRSSASKASVQNGLATTLRRRQQDHLSVLLPLHIHSYRTVRSIYCASLFEFCLAKAS